MQFFTLASRALCGLGFCSLFLTLQPHYFFPVLGSCICPFSLECCFPPQPPAPPRPWLFSWLVYSLTLLQVQSLQPAQLVQATTCTGEQVKIKFITFRVGGT